MASRVTSGLLCHATTHLVSTPLQAGSSGTFYPLSHFINYEKFSLLYQALLASISSHFEPQYFSEAIHDLKRLEAMAKAVVALEENGTWEFTCSPPYEHAVRYDWL